MSKTTPDTEAKLIADAYARARAAARDAAMKKEDKP
jgi:hypothetical protein